MGWKDSTCPISATDAKTTHVMPESLHAIGLTGTEEAVYLALLDRSPATAAELRKCLPGTPIRSAAAALEGRGLVSRLAGRPVRYQAAPPDVALEVLVRAHEQELQEVRMRTTELMAHFRAGRDSAGADEIVEVITTPEATLQRWEQLQRSAREQVRAFDRPPYVSTSTTNVVESELLARGVAYRCVYDSTGVAMAGRLAGIRGLAAQGEQARVATGVPVKMFLSDDSLALIPLEQPAAMDASLIIHASSLLDTMSALFESVWERAVPVQFGPDSADQTAPADQRTLVGMLAAGLTDEAIGRQLGWHPRTVQRHIRRIMDDLGAQTRFQAGMQAARRGWL